MAVCVNVNNESFEVKPQMTVGELIELGGGKPGEYELQQRDGPQGAVTETYTDAGKLIDLAGRAPSPGGPGGHVAQAGGASTGAASEGPGGQVVDAGGAQPGEGPKTHTNTGSDCAYFTTRFTGTTTVACGPGGPPFFEQFLERKKIGYEKKELGGCSVYVFEHVVPHGRHAGKTVTVGLPIPPDFPSAAPYGFHIKNGHGFDDAIAGENPSGLGSDWRFWSRNVSSWRQDGQSSQYYFDHVNKWLELD